MPGAPSDDRGPVGVVLAGGLGRRIGGDKAMVSLAGRPLVSFGLAALREALGTEPVVVAKRDTALPVLPDGVNVWVEPDEPRHPLTGIVHALRCSDGRDVLVLAVDLPLVGADLLRCLVRAAAEHRGGSAIACASGRAQPLCGVYAGKVLPALLRVGSDVRLIDVADQIGARSVEVADAGALLNVNTAQHARQAERLLTRA